MNTFKRDTTADLFNATLNLVKINGHYEKAAEIMDYYLPNDRECSADEVIEISNYRFDFYATAQFGGSEGIYIDCYLSGEYTETERKIFNHSKGTLETEKRRQVGTFKTLKDDLEAMKIMGELCGSLVYYAHQYVNQNIDRYTPEKELKQQYRYKNSHSARNQYISKLAENMASGCKCETCTGTACKGKQDGCEKGIKVFINTEVGKHCSSVRYEADKRNLYFNLLDSKYNAENDCFDEYVPVLMNAFAELSIYQAVGYMFVWLYTREKDFIFESQQEDQ